ncbi:MAG TPA: glycosyltransferase family 39 protein [Vicinamibacterales bacterium]|jgi:4-amino-4-deoxy-L-arabinose transferase-like glycosyltransferase
MPAAHSSLGASSKYVRLLCWAAIAWIVVFWRLGYPSLMDPDEAHYAELTREMVRAHSWLVPLLDGHPYIDKPILFHWLQAAAIWLLGPTEFAVRLPSALSALVLCWTVRRAGIVMFGESVGEWAAVMFATIPATFMLASLALFDMVFTAFLFGAVVCLIEASANGSRRREIAGYALLSLAVMIKGPVALVLVGLFWLAAWACGGELRARAGRLRWIAGLAGAAAVASPWFVWMFAHFGDAFVQDYLLAGNLYYFTQPEAWSARAISHVFYLRSFVGGFFPWSAVALAGLVESVRRRVLPAADERLLWIWSAVVIGFFSLARFKLDHYIFPAAPAICLLAAKAWHDAALAPRGAWRIVHAVGLGLGGLLVVAGTFASVYLFELNLELPATAILLPVALAAGGVGLLIRAAHSGWRMPARPFALAAGLLAIDAVIVGVGLPTLDHAHPTALVAQKLRDHTPSEAPAAIYQLEQWRASLRYYAERPLTGLSGTGQIRAFFGASDTPRYAIMVRRDYLALRAAGVRIHEVFRSPAVVGTTRMSGGLRRQQWDDLLVVTNAPRQRFPAWLP